MLSFVPWGKFLSASLIGSGKLIDQKVVIDANPVYGPAAGATVNVNDMTTFPPNSHWVITYPSSGNSTQDFENPDTFVKFELIRLPADLGGNAASASAFVAFSKVCVHLWCSPNYGGSQNQNPPVNREDYECPCHGSIYEVPDGKAKAGPASEQPPPDNAIPMLTLQAGSDGTLYIKAPQSGTLTDIQQNGIIGVGRVESGMDNKVTDPTNPLYSSYYQFILPTAKQTYQASETTTG